MAFSKSQNLSAFFFKKSCGYIKSKWGLKKSLFDDVFDLSVCIHSAVLQIMEKIIK